MKPKGKLKRRVRGRMTMCNLRVALPSEFNPRNPLISENSPFRL